MLLKIDFESDIPIYIQLKQQIIEGIAMGNIVNGESLPSVRQLAQDIGINLHTVNKTYNLLKNDGFIMMDRRKGAVISLEKKVLTEEYMEKIKEDMMPIIAEAYCKGMDKDQFLKICSRIYNIYSEENSHE